MIKPICTDILLLSRRAQLAGREHIELANDLADTLRAHRNECVGMAANMIGSPVAIIAVMPEQTLTLMLDPEIVNTSEEVYEAEEGCLCHKGTKKVTRYSRITLKYRDLNRKSHTKSFSGFTAQIIQHELDHLAGILV